MRRTEDGQGIARSVALVGFPAPFAEPFLALAETEGWQAVHLSRVPRPAELTRLGPSAVVLDADQLGGSFWGHLDELHRDSREIGIVVCSGRSTKRDRVVALRGGADFWLSKRIDPVELMAMVIVSTRGRRGGERYPREPIEAGDLSLLSGRVLVRGVDLALTRRELILLYFLATRRGICLAREEIYEGAWDAAMSEGGRAVDTTIAKLRRKLEAASPEYRYIHTQHGIGYWFEAMPVPALPSPLPHRRASSEPAPQVSLA